MLWENHVVVEERLSIKRGPLWRDCTVSAIRISSSKDDTCLKDGSLTKLHMRHII